MQDEYGKEEMFCSDSQIPTVTLNYCYTVIVNILTIYDVHMQIWNYATNISQFDFLLFVNNFVYCMQYLFNKFNLFTRRYNLISLKNILFVRLQYLILS